MGCAHRECHRARAHRARGALAFCSRGARSRPSSAPAGGSAPTPGRRVSCRCAEPRGKRSPVGCVASLRVSRAGAVSVHVGSALAVSVGSVADGEDEESPKAEAVRMLAGKRAPTAPGGGPVCPMPLWRCPFARGIRRLAGSTGCNSALAYERQSCPTGAQLYWRTASACLRAQSV